jgi:hypothetical protein
LPTHPAPTRIDEWGWLDNYPTQLKKFGNNHSAIVEQLDLLIPIKESLMLFFKSGELVTQGAEYALS